VDGFDDRVGRRRQEAVDKVGAGDGFRLGAAVALELGPDAGKGTELAIVVPREPDNIFLLRFRVCLLSLTRRSGPF
jgi:hypothetical protein